MQSVGGQYCDGSTRYEHAAFVGDLSDFKGAGSPTLARRFIPFGKHPVMRPKNRESASWSPFSSARLFRDTLWRRGSRSWITRNPRLAAFRLQLFNL